MLTPDEIQAMKERLEACRLHLTNKALGFYYRQDMPKLLLDREELQAEIERLKLDLKCEQINQPFYAEISEGFEEALGPHPTIPNGQWITRCKEQRQELDSLRRDAGRYWHLRDLVAVKDGDLFIARKAYDGYHSYLPLSERDSAIDAAIAQERKG